MIQHGRLRDPGCDNLLFFMLYSHACQSEEGAVTVHMYGGSILDGEGTQIDHQAKPDDSQ